MALYFIEDLKTGNHVDEYTTRQDAVSAVERFKKQNGGEYKVVVSE